ncbi:trigger factor [Campylobacter troglodytis]|uniref:trigger factor n=1 Tax=Campylobacter troglodytis TaxID=654363 RepID=UPI00115AFB74|nr:trigger factor [Campylobacter troglodytis]TQR55802.1 trigger factor [Campylobacter troglodytis]
MQVKATKIDSINASAAVEIPKTSLDEEVKNLAQKASKNIKMDGFRPGKVPVSAVIKRYEKELLQDAEQNLLKNAISLALKELQKENKELVAEPYVEKFERIEGGLSADLILSFKPEVKLEGYEDLIPKFTPPKAEQKEIDEKKKELLKSVATAQRINTKRALKEGDFAKFDFEGFVDGVAFEGGKAENFTLEIGSKQFIPGFEEGMIGMKEGEDKDIKVSFPENYNAKNLAGKEAIFKLKLHEIKELKLPELNSDILKRLLPNEETPTEKMLEEKLSEQIANDKLYKLINDELKESLAEALIDKFNFDLPKGVVEQETDVQFRNAFSTFTQQELEELKNDSKKYKEKRDSYKEEAAKSVKFTFIVDELARLRGLSVSDQEVVQAVYFEAYRYGQDPKALLESYRKQGILPAVKMSLIESKLFNDIFVPKKIQSADADKDLATTSQNTEGDSNHSKA